MIPLQAPWDDESHPERFKPQLSALSLWVVLLWNLSSEDGLKNELIDSALPVLTDSVVVPFTCWSDTSVNNNVHPDVFFSATGCLR